MHNQKLFKSTFAGDRYRIKRLGLPRASADVTTEELKKACALIRWRHGNYTEFTIATALAEIRAHPHKYHVFDSLPPDSVYSPSQASGKPVKELGRRIEFERRADEAKEGSFTVASKYPAPGSRQHSRMCSDRQTTNDGGEEQYMMSGAVHPQDRIRRRHSNDFLVCDGTFEEMAKYMPYKLIGRKDMNANMFKDPRSIEMIPWSWRTTVLGIERAIQEQESLGEYGTDQTLVCSLATRGGTICRANRVEYPEDISPIRLEDGSLQDPEYWEEVSRQGEVEWTWHLFSIRGELEGASGACDREAVDVVSEIGSAEYCDAEEFLGG